MDSFYITLVSNESIKYFPLNSPKNFTNILASDISLKGDYEVALSTLIFDQNTTEISEKTIDLSADNKILVRIPEEIKYNFILNSPGDSYLADETILNVIRENFMKASKYVTLLTDYNSDGEARLKIKVLPSHAGLVVLDGELALAMGFTQQVFKTGEQIAEKSFDIKRTDKTKQQTFIKIIKFEKKELSVGEPSDMSIDSIAEIIVDAFEEAKKPVLVTADSNEDFLSIQYDEEYMTFTLPSPICNYLKIDPNTVFEKGTSIINVQHLKQRVGNNHILCLSNIVDGQYYGGQILPILRIVPLRTDIKGTVIENFQPLFYVPVTQKHLKEINLKFSNIDFEKVVVGENKNLTAVLHFRRKNA